MALASKSAFPEPPAHGFQLFETLESEIEEEAYDSDHEHRGDNQVVALARIARVNDQITQAGVDCDHFARYDNQPRNAQCNSQADKDLRQGCGEDDFAQQLEIRQAEVVSGAPEDERHAGHASHGSDHDGKERSEKNQEDCSGIADAEKDNGDRNPCNGTDGPQKL